jgi:hypothetical protein
MFPYPLTVGMLASLLMFFIGTCYFVRQCFKYALFSSIVANSVGKDLFVVVGNTTLSMISMRKKKLP